MRGARGWRLAAGAAASLLLPCRNFLACSCVSTAHGLSALMLKCSHSLDTSPLFTFIRPEPSPRER